MYTFAIDKPKDIEEMLSRVSTQIRNNGGSFTGNENQGEFSGNGINGSYTINEDIQITILKKPFIFPMQEVETRIKDYFKYTKTSQGAT